MPESYLIITFKLN